MPYTSRFEKEIGALRWRLAGLKVEIKLIRLQRALQRRGWSDQPRAPAGQTDGGRWVAGPSGRWTSLTDSDRTPATPGGLIEPPAPEQAVLEDGTRILSIRIRSGPRAFDEQHTVVAPDGESRVFETSGATQTIRDGETGEVLARSTFTDRGAEPEAIFRPAFLPAVPTAGAATVELGLMLFGYLSARPDGYGTVFGMTAQEYRPGEEGREAPVVWVGKLDQSGLDSACPRNGEVQAITDEVARSTRAASPDLNATQLGTRIRFNIANVVRAKEDPDFTAELLAPVGKEIDSRNPDRQVRLDLYECARPGTACIYDYKTGQATLTAPRAFELAASARRIYPETRRIIIIQVRPNP